MTGDVEVTAQTSEKVLLVVHGADLWITYRGGRKAGGTHDLLCLIRRHLVIIVNYRCQADFVAAVLVSSLCGRSPFGEQGLNTDVFWLKGGLGGHQCADHQ